MGAIRRHGELTKSTHYEMFLTPKLADTLLPFLDGKSGVGSWAEPVEATRQRA